MPTSEDILTISDTQVYSVDCLPDITSSHKYSFYLRDRFRKYDEVVMPAVNVDNFTEYIKSLFETTADKFKEAIVNALELCLCNNP